MSTITKSSLIKAETIYALLTLLCIVIDLSLRLSPSYYAPWALWVSLAFAGIPLTLRIVLNLFKGEFGSDFLAAVSIIASVILAEYLAGALVVLMLSGGAALENFAVRQASSALEALSKRMPTKAHKLLDGKIIDLDISQIQIGDLLVIPPHEICPVDGVVVEGHGNMDESFLTGEPYQISKTPGSDVLSGALNGETLIKIKANKLPLDSRYQKIMQVMRTAELSKPHLRRMGDTLGALYTPFALVIALAAWYLSGDALRFLSVIVTATPCPLLIGIPTAIIGSISLCAKRSIIIKSPEVLEHLTKCRTIIFDKTGTLTYGEPELTEEILAKGLDNDFVLKHVASLERYSKHPLAKAVLRKAKQRNLEAVPAQSIDESPGTGLRGQVANLEIAITSRNKLQKNAPEIYQALPEQSAGLECVILFANKFAALYRFRDVPRSDGSSFISHLGPKHFFDKIMIVSGDRRAEVEFLAEMVGIAEIHAETSPEEKVKIVEEETARTKTIFIGDGINDAPALARATVGIAMGNRSDITSEAADVVLLEVSLKKIDELMHIASRMRRIVFESALGGIFLSIIAMLFASFGVLTPVMGAICQEIIDLFAVLNSLKAAWAPKILSDYAQQKLPNYT